MTFDPTSVQRGSGVALSRFRMSFSRCSTSGMAAKMPSCISAIARMLGTKNETLLSRLVCSVSASTVRIGVAPESWRFAAMTRPVAICWTAWAVPERLGSVMTVTATGGLASPTLGRLRSPPRGPAGSRGSPSRSPVDIRSRDSSSVPSVSSTGAFAANAVAEHGRGPACRPRRPSRVCSSSCPPAKIVPNRITKTTGKKNVQNSAARSRVKLRRLAAVSATRPRISRASVAQRPAGQVEEHVLEARPADHQVGGLRAGRWS